MKPTTDAPFEADLGNALEKSLADSMSGRDYSGKDEQVQPYKRTSPRKRVARAEKIHKILGQDERKLTPKEEYLSAIRRAKETLMAAEEAAMFAHIRAERAARDAYHNAMDAAEAAYIMAGVDVTSGGNQE